MIIKVFLYLSSLFLLWFKKIIKAIIQIKKVSAYAKIMGL